jgi:uncharacterized RDD family membrane protein YckC
MPPSVTSPPRAELPASSPPPPARTGPVDPLGRPLASFGTRIVALFIDLAVLFVPVLIVFAIVTAGAPRPTLSSANSSNLPTAYWEAFALGAIVAIAYFAFMNGSRRGQTVGKTAMHLAVRDVDSGGPIGAGRALVRGTFLVGVYLLFFIPLVLLALWPLWDAKRQALHDKLVRSSVVVMRDGGAQSPSQ